MSEFTQKIEELKNKIDNPIIKTHVGARVCNFETCSHKGKIQITSHYICPYCGWGLDTLEGYNPKKEIKV